MSIPKAASRQLLVSRAARESAFGGGATVDRRLLIHAPPVRPAANFLSPEPVLDGPAPADAARATWYEGAWAWDAVRPDDLAWVLSYALGPGTSTSVDGTATRHVILPGGAWALPSFSAEEVVAAGWQDRYTGGLLRALRLSGGPKPGSYGITMNADVLFRARASGSGSGSPVAGEPVWRFGQSRIWIGSAYGGTTLLGETNLSGATEMTGQWTGFSALFDNRVAPERAIDFYGSTVAIPERGTRAYDLRLSLEIADRTLLDSLIASAVQAVEIGWASGVLAGETVQEFGAHLIWPKVLPHEALARDGADGRVTVELAWRILSDATHGPFVGVVWNRTTPYAG